MLPVAAIGVVLFVVATQRAKRERMAEEGERERAEAARREHFANPANYAKAYISTTLKLTYITYIDDAKKNGIYLKGNVANKGNRDVSNVRIRIVSLEKAVPNPPWARSMDLGAVKAKASPGVGIRLPFEGTAKWNHRYRIEVESIRF